MSALGQKQTLQRKRPCPLYSESGRGSGGAFYLVAHMTFVEEGHRYRGDYYKRH